MPATIQQKKPHKNPQTMRRNYQGRGILFGRRGKLLGATMQAGRDGTTMKGVGKGFDEAVEMAGDRRRRVAPMGERQLGSFMGLEVGRE